MKIRHKFSVTVNLRLTPQPNTLLLDENLVPEEEIQDIESYGEEMFLEHVPTQIFKGIEILDLRKG